jgi:hypothetical protein
MSHKINHTMLSNGLDFLTRGLAEINSGNNSDLKYGVLHIFAGTLLVMKERLRQEHWTLLFSKTDKLSKKSYEGGDFPGIDSRILVDHLENVVGIKISESDKRALEELRKIRNKIEHFTFELSPTSIKTTSAKVLQFTIKFMGSNFHIAEFSEHEAILFEEITESSQQFREYIEAELKAIAENAKAKSLNVFYCPACHLKSLVQDESDLNCGVCFSKSPSLEDVIETHLNYELDMNSYTAGKEGYDLPIHTCKECSEEACVPMNKSANEFVCINCGDQTKTENLHHCHICNDIFYCSEEMGEEGLGGLCGACWDDQMAKD